MTNKLLGGAMVAILGLAATACGSLDKPTTGSQPNNAETINVAIMMPSGDTNNKEAVASAQRMALKMGVEATLVDLPQNYDNTQQANLIKTLIAQGKYQGILTQPYGPAATAALSQAIKAGMKVVTVHLPVDNDFSHVEVLPGQTAALLTLNSDAGKARGEAVVKDCEGIDPCKVALLQGSRLANSFESALEDGQLAVWKEHPNINVVQTLDAASQKNLTPYTIPAGRAVAEIILNTHPDLNVLVITGDQMWAGAYPVLVKLGLEKTVRSYGGGAAVEGAKAIAAGQMAGSAPVLLPDHEGCYGMQYLVEDIQGKLTGMPLKVNLNETYKAPAIIDAENVESFDAQWSVSGAKVPPYVC